MLQAAELADDRRQRSRHDGLVERREQEDQDQRAEDHTHALLLRLRRLRGRAHSRRIGSGLSAMPAKAQRQYAIQGSPITSVCTASTRAAPNAAVMPAAAHQRVCSAVMARPAKIVSPHAIQMSAPNKPVSAPISV